MFFHQRFEPVYSLYEVCDWRQAWGFLSLCVAIDQTATQSVVGQLKAQ